MLRFKNETKLYFPNIIAISASDIVRDIISICFTHLKKFIQIRFELEIFVDKTGGRTKSGNYGILLKKNTKKLRTKIIRCCFQITYL